MCSGVDKRESKRVIYEYHMGKRVCVCVCAYHWFWAVWQPVIWPVSRSEELEQQPSEEQRWCWTALWQLTHSNQQNHLPKSSRVESSSVEQLVHRESVWGTTPLDSASLSHFLCMCHSHIISFSLDPVWGTKLRLERGVGNKCWTLPDPLLFISLLSGVTRFLVSSLSICCSGLHINLNECKSQAY